MNDNLPPNCSLRTRDSISSTVIQEILRLSPLPDNLSSAILQQLKVLPDPVNILLNLPNELLVEICIQLAKIDPLSIPSLEHSCSHMTKIIQANEQEIWKHALYCYYPLVAKGELRRPLEKFIQCFLWCKNKQTSFDLKPRDMGPWKAPHHHLAHCHDQTTKPSVSTGKLELQVHEGFQSYGTNVLFCGVMPYEYSVPIPNTPLCAHICRPSLHRQRRENRILGVVNMHTSKHPFYPKNMHADLISNVAVRGDLIVTSSLDSTVKVWEIHPESLEPLQLRHTLHGHSGWVNAVALDGDTVVSAGSDHTAQFWNASSGKLCKSIKNLFLDYGFGVFSVCLRDNLFGCGSVFGPYLVYDMEKNDVMHSLDEPLTFAQYTDFINVKHQEYSSLIKFTSSTILTTSRLNDHICVWSLNSGELLHRLPAGGNIHTFCVSIQQDILMCSLCNGSMRLWSATNCDTVWKRANSKKTRNVGHGITWICNSNDSNENTLFLV